MRGVFKPTHVVLALLCLMYFITYVDRVNIATAANSIKTELGFSNTELGLIFSAFGYPYALFQIFGGWMGDRFGPRKTLFWCGLIWATATVLTGLAGGLASLFLVRILLGIGEGATFPTATRAMQYWTAPGRRGFAQGITHSFARLGNSVTPLLVASLIAAVTWRGSFVILGVVSFVWVLVWVWYFRDEPKDHPAITAEELAALPAKPPGPRPSTPLGALFGRMWPVTLTYFCYGWVLWLYLNWLPSFFLNTYKIDLKTSALASSAVFFAGVVGDTLGGVLSDAILHKTGNLRFARLSIVLLGFVGAFVSLIPLLYYTDITTVALSLAAGFFFAELIIGPIWSVPMDIAPKFSGTAAGLMNTGSAVAAIVSPTVAGFVIDITGNYQLPFIMTMGVLALGAACTFLMRPEIPYAEADGVIKTAPAE